MKARVAGRHDGWLPLPSGKLTPRLKQAMTYFQILYGTQPATDPEKKRVAVAMLHFYLGILDRRELAIYYRFVGRVLSHAHTVKTQKSTKTHRKNARKSRCKSN